MMDEDAKSKTPSALTDEFDERIVVPFRGSSNTRTEPLVRPRYLDALLDSLLAMSQRSMIFVFDGLFRQFAKLLRLAQHHNSTNYPVLVGCTWPCASPSITTLVLSLCMMIRWRDCFIASWFHADLSPQRECTAGTQWHGRGWPHISKILIPETLAMLIPRDRKSKLTDRELCELFVVAADEEMKKRKDLLTKISVQRPLSGD